MKKPSHRPSELIELSEFHKRIRERELDRKAYAQKIISDEEILKGMNKVQGRRLPAHPRFIEKRERKQNHIEARTFLHILVLAYGGYCLDCGNESNLVVDHIIPLYRKGTNYIENLQPLCSDCNFKKGSKIIDYRPGPFPEELYRLIL